MNKIIIISVEGTESYTEVNFFKGIGYQEQKLELLAFGLAKARREKVKKKNLEKIHHACEKIGDIKSDIWIFFVGDGDVKKDIKTMNETFGDTKEILNKCLSGKLHFSKLLLPKDKKFEEELRFNFPTKRATYLDGFKHFLDKKEMWNKDEINWTKLLNYFDETVYKEIFRKIFDLK